MDKEIYDIFITFLFFIATFLFGVFIGHITKKKIRKDTEIN